MCKQKKPKSKAKKIVVRLIEIVLAIAVIVIAGAIFIFRGDIKDVVYMKSDVPEENYEKIDISMTKEEMLKDFDIAYEYAVLSNPNSPEFEEVYGIDFEDMYKEYRGYVEECETEFDFNFVLYTYLRNIPSGHTNLAYADPSRLRTIGFQMFRECGEAEDEDKYLYSWEKYLEESFEQYDLENTKILSFVYVSGSYITSSLTAKENPGCLLLSIDGKDPVEYAKEPLQFGKLEYDEINDIVYRDNIVFNDKAGKPVTVKYETYDGEIVEKEMFVDDKFVYAYANDQAYKSFDKDYLKEEETNEEESGENEPDENEPKDEKSSYKLAEDDENGLVYVQIDNCIIDQMKNYETELKEALSDKENVIIDIRNNGGGEVVFCENILYPSLFTDDLETKKNIILGKNDMTEEWAKKPLNVLMYSSRIQDDGTIFCKESIEYKGKAEKDLNVYLLVSENTFSSADIITRVFSEKENVTIVGRNTGGEGWDGSIFAGVLPNSHLIVTYSPGKNIDTDISDSVWGTSPDVVCPYTTEAVRYKQKLQYDGVDCDKYENKIIWDNTLQETINLINNRE